MVDKQTHLIQTPARRGSLEVTEQPDRIILRLRFDKYGALGDDAELENWMRPIFEAYEADPRPFVLDHPGTGQVATIWGDRDQSVLAVFTPDSRPCN